LTIENAVLYSGMIRELLNLDKPLIGDLRKEKVRRNNNEYKKLYEIARKEALK